MSEIQEVGGACGKAGSCMDIHRWCCAKCCLVRCALLSVLLIGVFSVGYCVGKHQMYERMGGEYGEWGRHHDLFMRSFDGGDASAMMNSGAFGVDAGSIRIIYDDPSFVGSSTEGGVPVAPIMR